MAKVLEILKSENLIDERELWTAGQVRKINIGAIVGGAIGGAIGAMANMRYFSVNGNDLIVTIIKGKQASVVEVYNKSNVESATIKSGFLGLTKNLIIQPKGANKVVFEISSKKKEIYKMIEIFK